MCKPKTLPRAIAGTAKNTRSAQDPTLGGDAGEATEVAVRVRFSEDRNFEPPQGSLEVIEVSPSKARAP